MQARDPLLHEGKKCIAEPIQRYETTLEPFLLENSQNP